MTTPGQPLTANDLTPAGLAADDVLVLLVAAGVFLMVWSMGQWLFPRDRFTPRLRAIQQRRAELKSGQMAASRRRRPGHGDTMSLVRRVVVQLKLLQQHQVGQLQQKLVQAGYRGKDAVVLFAFAKLVMPLAGLVFGVLLSGIDWAHPFRTDAATGWFLLLGMGYGCARLPELLVANQRGKRYYAMRRALPDALDLMIICAEAGLSLAASLERVARELGRISPSLAEELSLTSVELGFLPDRTMALKHLAERVDIKEMRGLVNVIAQTEKYGTPIAQALRVLAREFRTERMLQAEQKAARLPALMTVPMIVFILPTLFIIVMTPAIISVMDSL